jgi:hypothetical protein
MLPFPSSADAKRTESANESEPTALTATSAQGDLTGGRLHVVFSGFSATPIVQSDSPALFEWRGTSLLGHFIANHQFRFEDSKANPGMTRFVQSESFEGVFGAVLGVLMKGMTKSAFDEFNTALKVRVESIGE